MTNKVTFPKKVPFKKNVTAQTFSEQIANLHPKPKKGGLFYLKAEGQMISEQPGLTLCQKNLGNK